jgi:GLPGLI family protein
VAKLNFKVFKNHPDDKITYVDMPMILVNLKYETDYFPLKWNILSEKKEVLGYPCQKAAIHFAGRDYIAWFTTEIPLQDAPYRFDGLPGFIVKIEDTRKHYTFEFQRIENYKESDVKIFMLNLGKEVTRQEFLEKQQEIHTRDMHSILADSGFEFSLANGTEEDERRMQKNIRRLSNYIELE